MKFLGFALRYYLRNKLRFFFTTMSVIVAIFLFCVLESLSGFYELSSDESRLIVVNDVSLHWGLPLSYFNQIEKVKGVKKATYFHVTGGQKEVEIFGSKRQEFISMLSIDPETYFEIVDEITIAPENMTKFKNDPRSCLVGSSFASRFLLEAGDFFAVEYPRTGDVFEFVVAGVYKAKKITEESTLYFHYKYHAQKDSLVDGKVLAYGVQVEDPNKMGEITKEIDSLFASTFPTTRSLPERVFATNLAATRGNFDLILRTIGFIVLLVTLLVIANTLVMATRKQVAHLTTLRVLGYSKRFVQVLVMGESFFVCLIGGGLSCFFADKILWILSIKSEVLVQAMGLALIMAVLSGIVPTMIATGKNLSSGLRSIE